MNNAYNFDDFGTIKPPMSRSLTPGPSFGGFTKAPMSRSLTPEFSIGGFGVSDAEPQRRRIAQPVPRNPVLRPLEEIGARSAWSSRPGGHAMDRNGNRSRSPMPSDRQPINYRSRTPPRPSDGPSVPRSRIPREINPSTSVTYDILSAYQSEAARPARVPHLEKPQSYPEDYSSRFPEDKWRSAGPLSQHTRELRPKDQPDSLEQERPRGGLSEHTKELLPPSRRGQSNALAGLVPKPLAAQPQPKRQPRKHIPSMVGDYLSLDELEDLWQSQDMYLGTVCAPVVSKPKKLLFTLPEGPRSPITAIHPAFRNDSPADNTHHNSFACV